MEYKTLEAKLTQAAELRDRKQLEDTTVALEEAKVLETLRARVLKALPIRPIKTGNQVHNCNSCNHSDRGEYSDIRGVLLAETDRGDRGTLSDGDVIDTLLLYATKDGYVEAHRTGHLSHWQDAWWGWEATIKSISVEDALEYSLDQIVQTVDEQLDKYIVSLSASSTARLERAQKLLDALKDNRHD